MTASRPLLEDCSIISRALRRAALTGSVITCSSAWGHSDYQLPRTSIHVELLHWPTDSEHPTIRPDNAMRLEILSPLSPGETTLQRLGERTTSFSTGPGNTHATPRPTSHGKDPRGA